MGHDGMMDDTIDEAADAPLRALYGRALALRGSATSGGGATVSCVAPEDILALVRRELPEERRLEVLDHVMACDACRREFDLLRAVEAAGGDQAAVSGGPGRAGDQSLDQAPRREPASSPKVIDISTRRARTWRRVVPFAIAASLMLVVGVEARRRAADEARPEVMRGEESGINTVTPAGDVTGVALGTAPVVFVWQPVAGARRYEFEVLDGDGTVVYSAATADTTIAVAAADAAERFRAGVEYQWWVRAVTPDATQPRSALRPFRLLSE
jgi:hypothetical protein